MEKERLLRVRRRLKGRKPEFRRYGWHKKIKIRNKMWSWRRPRGISNKLKKRYGGKWSGRIPVNIGFRSPKAVRGLHPSGLEEVLVFNPSDLERIDKEKLAVRIASSVGMKKRLEIEDKAKELGIKVLNPSR